MPVRPRSKRSASALGDERGRAAIDFIEQCCVHTIGKWANDPFILAPWQRDFIYEVFSNVARRTVLRRTRRAFLQIARKNGKSELAAAVALYLLLADGEQSPQVYGAAIDRDQASTVFDVAAQMVYRSEALRNEAQVVPSTKRIICPANGGFYRAIPADAAGSHGFNASGIIFDELHTQKTRDLWDVLSTSTGARDQPLIFAITTAGFDKRGICYQVYEYAKGVINGTINDPTFVTRVYELPPKTTFEMVAESTPRGRFIHEKDLWPLANPSLIGQPGGFLKPDEIRRAVREATHQPSAQNHVLNLHFNIWTDAESAWLSLAEWDACAEVGKTAAQFEKEWAGRECFGGLDLSSTKDFTAWVLLFPRDDGGYDVLPRFFIPKVGVDNRGMMSEDIKAWARAGFITLTDPASQAIDFGAVAHQIEQDGRTFDILQIGYDATWHAPHIINLLDGFDVEMAKVGQYPAVMNAPCRLLEKLVADRTLHHYGNPVLRWMIGNTVIERNVYQAIRPSKRKSPDKIDGVSALVTALERAIAPQEKKGYVGVVAV